MNAAVDVLRSIISYQNAQIWSVSASPKLFPYDTEFLRSIPVRTVDVGWHESLAKITLKKKKKKKKQLN